MSNSEKGLYSGYVDCGCRDCFEIAIGFPGDFCNECEDAGCEHDSECNCDNLLQEEE